MAWNPKSGFPKGHKFYPGGEKGWFKKGHPKPKNAHVWGDKEKNPNWRGGRLLNHNGYVLVQHKDHPFKDSRGYVFEHRLVMEKKLGRFLEAKEVVHHKNHDIQDNRIENLQLFKNHSEHLKHENQWRKRNDNGTFKKGKAHSY